MHLHIQPLLRNKHSFIRQALRRLHPNNQSSGAIPFMHPLFILPSHYPPEWTGSGSYKNYTENRMDKVIYVEKIVFGG